MERKIPFNKYLPLSTTINENVIVMKLCDCPRTKIKATWNKNHSKYCNVQRNARTENNDVPSQHEHK